jgi:phosphomannomutase
LRASNTEPLIRFNMETRGDKLLLEEKKKAIMEFIKNQN